MENEGILTKYIRPAMLLWSYIFFSVIIVLDGNIGSFQIRSEYIPIMQSVITTITMFYFSSRGIEKITKEIKKGK